MPLSSEKGLLIPDPDLYIAATALQHHLTLVTRIVRDINVSQTSNFTK